MQHTVTHLEDELSSIKEHRAESVAQERIVASVRAANRGTSLPANASDLPLFPKSHDDLLRRCFALSFNPLANRILKIPCDLLHQYATPFHTEDLHEEEILEAYWNDPINNFPEFSRQIIYNYGLYGEQCFTVFTNGINKHVRHGEVNPYNIDFIISDPDNPRIPIGVRLKTKKLLGNLLKPDVDEILLVLRAPGKTEMDLYSPETRAFRKQFKITDPLTGRRVTRECFLFQEQPRYDTKGISYQGQSLQSLRGTPDLTTIHDWVLATDDILASMIERADLLSRTLWTLQVEGGNLREGDELNLDTLKQRFGTVPNRWEVRVTNEKMKYERHDAPVGNSDMTELLEAVQMYIIGGVGYPETWFLGGRNSNKASSLTMEFPTLKKLENRQHTINNIYDTLCTYQVMEAGIHKPTFKLVNTPLKDTLQKTLTESLMVLGTSLATAQSQNWLSHEEAGTVYRKLIQDLGVKLADRPNLSEKDISSNAPSETSNDIPERVDEGSPDVADIMNLKLVNS